MRTHFRTCHLCEAMCGIAVDVDGERVLAIRGDQDDPFSRGHICPKAPALADVHTDPDRLRRPLKRTPSGDFVEVGWPEALAEVAERLHGLQSKHGHNAVATYIGNPAVHNHGTALFAPMLNRTLRTRNRYSATSVDQLPAQLTSYFMLGHQLLFPIPDVDRTRHMIIVGANPLASMGSLMTAPGIKERLLAIRARGGKVIVVDPRRSETAGIADEHVFVRPGADAFVLWAMVHVILRERGARLGALAPLVRGLDAVERIAADFAPEVVAEASGVPAATMRRLALDFADSAPALVYGRVGASTQTFGALCHYAINTLNIITGNFDSPGGVMFTRPAVDALAAAAGVGIGRGSYGRWTSRVRKFPEAGGELPVATLAEDILTPGEGKIRALVTIAGNPVLSTPNGAQLDRALMSLDFMVSIDIYLNATSRHASFILPPTSPLERSHYDAALHVVAVRNTAKWSAPIFAPPADALHDWQILLELKRRLERLRGGRLRAAAENAVLKRLGPDGLVDVALRAGPYGLRKGLGGLSLRRLEREVHGVDLGALTPQLPGRLPAEHRFVDLAPQQLVADVARLRAALATPARDGQLLLIGRRHLRSNNSWMHNSEKLMAGKRRCTLLMHPEDATRLGLGDGQLARVRSRVGEVQAAIQISDEIMRGVVSLPHGFGHARDGIRLGVATRPENAGVSANDLTDDQLIDELAGTAALSGVPVTVAGTGS